MRQVLMTSLNMLKSIPRELLLEGFFNSTVLVTERSNWVQDEVLGANVFQAVLTFDDYFDNSLVETSIIELHQEESFDKIISLSEGDILRAANLRTLLAIPGQDYSEALLFRDKLLMKEHAARHGLAVSLPRALNLLNDDAIKYPLVIKPKQGRGSFNTNKVDTPAELDLMINSLKKDDYVMESYISGEIFHIDGLFAHGKLQLCSSAKYFSTCLDFINGRNLGSYTLLTSNPYYKRLRSYAKYLVEDVFPMPDASLFHIELFIDENDNIVLCEIACRLGGNDLVHEVRQAYHVNLINEYFLHMASADYHKAYIGNPICCSGRYMIPPKCGKLSLCGTEPQFDGVTKVTTRAKTGQIYNKMLMSNNDLVRFLTKTNTEDEMLELFNRLKDWQHKSMIWEEHN